MTKIILSLTLISAGQLLFAAECKFVGSNANAIVGSGQDESAAFQDAAIKCFDELATNFTRTHHIHPPEDRILDFIDSCVNRSCE